MEAILKLEAKLDQELWLVIVYYISYISYDFKMFGGMYENGAFYVVPVRYVPCLKISLILSLLSTALQATVELPLKMQLQ